MFFDNIMCSLMKLFKRKKGMNDMSEENKNENSDNNQPQSAEEKTVRHAEEVIDEAEKANADAQPTAEAADTTVPETDNSSAEKDSEADKKADDKNKHDKHHKCSEQDAKVQEMGEKLAAMNDKYVRLYSEYENYRKRTNQEKADLLLNGGKDVLKTILPVVDDMERALKNIPDDNTAKEGVQLVYNKFVAALNQRGVKEIEAQGAKFDENLHEAVTRIPAAEEAQKGNVVDVLEKGYMLNDKVLRFAKVVVAF